jgi:FkbM family methyltransferase
MKTRVKRFLRILYGKLSSRLLHGSSLDASLSYSQSGEDMIVNFILNTLELSNPTYLDIGAHHPTYLSNTAFFYSKGCKGINIEPDPVLFKAIIKKRKDDINLNIGIGTQQGSMEFYLLSSPTMNTFSKEAAEELVSKHGMSIKQVIRVPVDTLINVINQYCDGNFPDFLSIDIEGLDLEILKTIDYQNSHPKVICVETISYSTSGNGKKDINILNFLQEQNYILYADTYINSIFVWRSDWEH